MMAGRAVTETEALGAAYACFTRTGVRRTAMGDIAQELGRSRPVVYRHFADKEGAYRQVAQHILTGTLDEARRTSQAGPAADRVLAVVDAKLRLAIRLRSDSPHHWREILATDGDALAEQAGAYMASLAGLIVAALAGVYPEPRARDLAEILLALTRGLENDLSDPQRSRALLRLAVEGLAGPAAEPASGREPARGSAAKP